MTEATAPTAPVVDRAILTDRWDARMEWRRTGGNASQEYTDLVAALAPLLVAVAGHDDVELVMDDDLLFSIGQAVVDAVQHAGIAR